LIVERLATASVALAYTWYAAWKDAQMLGFDVLQNMAKVYTADAPPPTPRIEDLVLKGLEVAR